MNDLPSIPALLGVTTVARVCAWCPSKKDAEKWATENGHAISHGMCPVCEETAMQLLEDVNDFECYIHRPVSIGGPLPHPREAFGQIAPLDKVAKAELFLRYYGWRYSRSGDGPDALPPVDDQARIVELVCNRNLSFSDAVKYLEFEKAQRPNTSLAAARDEQFRVLNMEREAQLDAKEQSVVDSLDTFGNIY